MRFCQRSRLILLVTATAATSFLSSCGATVRTAARGVESVRDSTLFYQGRHGPLSKQEQMWAQVAWKYFQNNTNAATGLVNGIPGKPNTTMVETADYIAALLAAHRMKLSDDKDFQDRVTKLLSTLNTMQLAGDMLPNRNYSTENANELTADGKPGPDGWSSVDLGRLLLWLRILRERTPEFSEYIDRSVMRWNMCDALDKSGNLLQATFSGTTPQIQVDGRLGAKEYAAHGFESWGLRAEQASRIEPYEKVKIDGVELIYDGRDERKTGTLAPILSEPYLESGMEMSWSDSRAAPRPEFSTEELASRVYRVQEARYRQEKILTARTEHRINHAPFFAVDSIFVAGYSWNTVSPSGERLPNDALVATQAVFPIRALWKTPYSERLLDVVEKLYEADKGWYEGRLEKTGGIEYTISLRTNAMVLESLFYQLEGRLYRNDGSPGLYELWMRDPFRANASCLASRSM